VSDMLQLVCVLASKFVVRGFYLDKHKDATKHRRVIHLEYAMGSLTGGLQWQES